MKKFLKQKGSSLRAAPIFGGIVCLAMMGFSAASIARIKINSKVQRICSNTLASDEFLRYLVPPSRVVCVTRYADDPLYSNVVGHYPKSIVRIASDLEKIIAQRPELVIVAPYNQTRFLQQLKSTKLKVWVNKDINSFAQVSKALRAMGQLTGEVAKANSLADRFSREAEQLKKTVSCAAKKPTVLFWGGDWTAGRDTMIGDLIHFAGGVNAASKLGIKGIGTLTTERALGVKPDVIFMHKSKGTTTASVLAKHPALRSAQATRNGRLYFLPANLTGSVSFSVLEGAKLLARKIHPKCFAGK